MIAGTPITLFNCATELVFSEALQKFPNLKIALSEGGIGWIPYFLERADYTFQQHKAWTRPDLGGRLPSEIFRDHFVVAPFPEENVRRVIDEIGIDVAVGTCTDDALDGGQVREGRDFIAK